MKRKTLIFSFSGIAILLAFLAMNAAPSSSNEVSLESEAMMQCAITANIEACLPAAHPYGRYTANVSCTNGCNWSSNYATILSSSGDYAVVKANSIGWFTLYVKDNSGNTLAACNFYADNCGF